MKIAPSTARVYIYNVNPVSWGGNFYKHIALTGQFHSWSIDKGAGELGKRALMIVSVEI